MQGRNMEDTDMDVMDIYHELLKADEWVGFFENRRTDQQEDRARPDVEKPPPAGAVTVDLMDPADFTVGATPTIDVIRARRSHRYFTAAPLSFEEFSFLLWATQGIRDANTFEGVTYYTRNVPSGGNRHPFETYLAVNRVTDLAPGLYRYLPIEHQLVLLGTSADLPDRMYEASLEQASMHEGKPFPFIREAAVVFVWTVTPYRTEWRYGPVAPKLMAIDSGHICQNLYLACGAIDAGTCAVGAFDRSRMDAVLGVDGDDEFTFYMAPVGKIER